MGVNVGCILNLCLYPNFILSSRFMSTRKTRHCIPCSKELNIYMKKVILLTLSWEEWEYSENNQLPFLEREKLKSKRQTGNQLHN